MIHDGPVITPDLGRPSQRAVTRESVELHAIRRATKAREAARHAVQRKLALTASQHAIRRAVAGQTSATGLMSVGGAVTLGLISMAVVGRLASGRSFEGMGREVEEWVWGDQGDKAIAASMTRKQLEANPNLMTVVGDSKDGEVQGQVQQLYRELFSMHYRQIRGQRDIERKFDVNSSLDNLILRIAAILKAAWTGSGLEDLFMRIVQKLKWIVTTAVKIRDGFFELVDVVTTSFVEAFTFQRGIR